jgi:hypothetical protein
MTVSIARPRQAVLASPKIISKSPAPLSLRFPITKKKARHGGFPSGAAIKKHTLPSTVSCVQWIQGTLYEMEVRQRCRGYPDANRILEIGLPRRCRQWLVGPARELQVGQVEVANELRKLRVTISTRQCVLHRQRHNLDTMKKRLKALEARRLRQR